jgi:hypothetical protein
VLTPGSARSSWWRSSRSWSSGSLRVGAFVIVYLPCLISGWRMTTPPPARPHTSVRRSLAILSVVLLVVATSADAEGVRNCG